MNKKTVKRNCGRVPDEFLLLIKQQEVTRLISQFVTSNDPAQPFYSSGLMPPVEEKEPPRPRIGFSVRERRAAYRVKNLLTP